MFGTQEGSSHVPNYNEKGFFDNCKFPCTVQNFVNINI